MCLCGFRSPPTSNQIREFPSWLLVFPSVLHQLNTLLQSLNLQSQPSFKVPEFNRYIIYSFITLRTEHFLFSTNFFSQVFHPLITCFQSWAFTVLPSTSLLYLWPSLLFILPQQSLWHLSLPLTVYCPFLHHPPKPHCDLFLTSQSCWFYSL